MWIAAAEDRLYWLLPDKIYTVGRASIKNQSSVDIALRNDTSVSRKHLTLQVHHPNSEVVLHPSIRSDSIVTDSKSRYGTRVDGKSLVSGGSVSVPQVPNGMLSVKSGHESTKSRLKWSSYVVTYLTGQSGDAHETLFDHAFKIAEQLDLRLTSHSVSATDVLVITGKATSSLYYALCKQIPVVNTQFLEALKENGQRCSEMGTSDSSVLPTLDSFYPDPSYRPNPKRKHLLRNCEFKIPDPNFDKIMRPIVMATDGTVSEKASTLLVSSKDDPHLHNNVKYILGTTLFALITDARSLDPEDIQTFREEPNSSAGQTILTTSPKKRKPVKQNSLDIMTSQESQEEMPEAKKRKVATSEPEAQKPEKPRRMNILNMITSQDSSPALEYSSVHLDKSMKERLLNNVSSKYKQSAASSEDFIPRKKAKKDAAEKRHHTDNASYKESHEDFNNIASKPHDNEIKSAPARQEWNFDELANLIAVTNEVPSTRNSRPATNRFGDNSRIGTPNFKGFKRKNHSPSSQTDSISAGRQKKCILKTYADSTHESSTADTSTDKENHTRHLDGVSAFAFESPDKHDNKRDKVSKAGKEPVEEDDGFAFSFT